MYLFIFEFIGTQEFVLILVAALILFGPRKLPELARSVGKSLSEFKRASEDFKDQWEREVDRDATSPGKEIPPNITPPAWEPATATVAETPATEAGLVPVTATTTTAEQPAALTVAETPAAPASKGDWL